MEIWKDIAGCEGFYQVSNLGRVKSLWNGREHIMKLYTNNKNYLYVLLSQNGKQKPFLSHRLVAKAFIPNPENKPEVNHINGDKADNRADNLEWVTRAENLSHAFAMGLSARGEDSHNAKLTNEQVRFIRENPKNLTGKQLAKLFRVSQTTISRVKRGIAYLNAGGETQKAKNQRIPNNIREQIKRDYIPRSFGHGCRTLSKKYGVTSATVWRIVHGKN